MFLITNMIQSKMQAVGFLYIVAYRMLVGNAFSQISQAIFMKNFARFMLQTGFEAWEALGTIFDCKTIR